MYSIMTTREKKKKKKTFSYFSFKLSLLQPNYHPMKLLFVLILSGYVYSSVLTILLSTLLFIESTLVDEFTGK